MGTPAQLDAYLDLLIADLAASPAEAQHRGLELPVVLGSAYLGGGTPSLLSARQLARLFTAIRAHFAFSTTAEITLEAAPAFLSDELLAAAADQGVNRFSFGVQSFVDAEARATGRLHTREQALRDLARVRARGMATGVDLIAGLPGQTAASWRTSLAVLQEAAPEHASVYMLEVDEDSRLGSELLGGGTRYGASLAPSDDAVADFYTEACERLEAAGLHQYEISNFAAEPPLESRHNHRYWARQPYLGLGLDAHSMLRDADDRAVRFRTGDELGAWLAAPAPRPWEHTEALTPKEELEEAWFLGLRRTAGVSLPALVYEFSPAAIAPFAPLLRELEGDGLLKLTPQRARLTPRGRLLSNDVFARLLQVTDDDLLHRPEHAQTHSTTPELALR